MFPEITHKGNSRPPTLRRLIKTKKKKTLTSQITAQTKPGPQRLFKDQQKILGTMKLSADS